MIHILASLFFVIIGGFSLILLVAMIRANWDPMLSALCGYGAYPVDGRLVDDDPAPRSANAHPIPLRRPARVERPAFAAGQHALTPVRRAAA